MCDERERLIGYVYDDCDGRERQEIETHLSSCETCRAEIAGLRRVRQDLLAWEVPEHESVWRPFVPARPVFSWRDMPVWAMAAAASVLLLAGAAGGVATHALLTPDAAVTATERPTAAPMVVPVAPTAAIRLSASEVAALEQRILETVRAEMDKRAQAIAASDQDRHLDLMSSVYAGISGLNRRTGTLEQKDNLTLYLASLVPQEGATGLPVGR